MTVKERTMKREKEIKKLQLKLGMSIKDKGLIPMSEVSDKMWDDFHKGMDKINKKYNWDFFKGYL